MKPLSIFRCASLAICLAFATATVHAAPDADARAQARRLYRSGTTHYNLSEFRQALDDFKAAYRYFAEPVLLFNVAQCYRRIGDPAQAGEFYRAFRREAPAQANRQEIDRLIDEMDRAVAERRAQQPPTAVGASAELEGNAAPPAAAEPPPSAAAAAPSAAVTPAATSPRRDRPPLYKRWWLWTIVGVAAVGVGVGLGVGLSSGTSYPSSPAGAMTIRF